MKRSVWRVNATNRAWLAVGMLGVLGLAPVAGVAAESDAARLAELERKVEILTKEAESRTFGDVIGKPGEGVHGMGPAASKIYHQESGVSIGGYGEALYQNFDGDKVDDADFLRGVLYVGNKFNERWLLNTEIEFEHANTDQEGEASVEFAYLDYLYRPELNFRAGLVLLPMGLVNELHEPTVFLGARRPDTENRIIPTTWRENGVGLFGAVGPVSYKAYVVNGLAAEGFTARGLREGKSDGSHAPAEDLAGVGRVDWNAVAGVTVGASAYYGDSGQDLDAAVTTEIYDLHLDVHRGPVQFRALATQAELSDVAELNRVLATAEDGRAPADADVSSVGEKLTGWYTELGVDVASLAGRSPLAVIPFVRYEAYNTQDEIPAGFARSGTTDVDVTTVGVNIKPMDQIVFKADYQFYDNAAGSAEDQFNLAMGYVF